VPARRPRWGRSAGSAGAARTWCASWFRRTPSAAGAGTARTTRGEPGAGKSVGLQLIVAHGALSPDCRLILVDGKRVELGLWRDCADRFIGPCIDDAIDTLHWLQDQIDERTEELLARKLRKITPGLGWPVYLVPVDEVAYYSATVGSTVQQKEFNACNRDIVARGRAPGIIPVEATQRPSADIIPTSLRDLFGYRWAFRCSTEASSDTILGHGWASQGYSATEIDPQARGVSWLRAEDGIPRRVKAAYLTDEQIIHLAGWAAQARATHHAGDGTAAGNVLALRRDGDAA
jgi:DNA segregation ATPase FtsK/SpoIIIE, S-DNA-T family